MKYTTINKFIFVFIFVAIAALATGCIELLELGEVDTLAADGIAVDEVGTLALRDPAIVSEEMLNVRMVEDGELSIFRNGKLEKFAELEGDTRLILQNGKTIQLPGPLYELNGNVFVKQSPFSSGGNIFSTSYTSGQMVIINDQVGAWYEIMLPEHHFGFIPAVSAAPAHSRRNAMGHDRHSRPTGYRKGVNYIINNAFLNTAAQKEMIVNITYGDGSFDQQASLKLSSFAAERGYRSTASFFSKYYYTDELGKRLLLGNLVYIHDLQLFQHADYLLIGNCYTKVRVNQLQADMLTADLSYTVNLVNLKDGSVEKTFSNTIHGNGFTDDQARDDARSAFFEIIHQSNL